MKIISVGGSIIIPKTGFDIEFLKKFRNLIISETKKGEQFLLIIGGGSTCRIYQKAANDIVKLNNEDLDQLGIDTTIFNANFVKLLFKDYAYPKIATNPNKKIKTDKPIIIAAGWKPGCSTDKDAVLHAKTYGAKELINLSNIDYVYDKDPNKFSEAKKIEKINWEDFRKNVVGYKWVAGKNTPFDPMASELAQKLKLKVSILKGTDLKEVKKALNGEKFRGTVVSD